MSKDLNVLNSTNQDGLLPKLESVAEELAVCEKALADYMETKRIAFPRFYFVSVVDLLDILSNGWEINTIETIGNEWRWEWEKGMDEASVLMVSEKVSVAR